MGAIEQDRQPAERGCPIHRDHWSRFATVWLLTGGGERVHPAGHGAEAAQAALALLHAALDSSSATRNSEVVTFRRETSCDARDGARLWSTCTRQCEGGNGIDHNGVVVRTDVGRQRPLHRHGTLAASLYPDLRECGGFRGPRPARRAALETW